MRVIKSGEELECIRAAAKITGNGMQAAIEASREGTDENAVASATTSALILAGSQYVGLPQFISSGPRSSIPHATWSGRRYRKQDVLLYELAGVVKRYCAALFRTGTVGKPDAEFARRAPIVRESLESIIAAIKPGALPSELYAIHQSVFKKYGYSHLLTVGQRIAYSVGINYPPDWGEGHIISIWEGDQRPLRPGMTFHVAPGFIEPLRYSLFFSETILVSHTGCEVLTSSPRETFVA
jgi:Xaa-Pro dipeptidase